MTLNYYGGSRPRETTGADADDCCDPTFAAAHTYCSDPQPATCYKGMRSRTRQCCLPSYWVQNIKKINTKKLIQWYYEFFYCDLIRYSGQCSGDTCCIDPATGENIGTGYCQVRVPDYDPANPGNTPPTPNPNPQHPDGTKDICYDVKLSDDAGWDGTVDTEAQQALIQPVDDYFCTHMDSLNFGPTQDEVISPSENGGLGDCRK